MSEEVKDKLKGIWKGEQKNKNHTEDNHVEK